MNVLMPVDFSSVTAAMLESLPALLPAREGAALHIHILHVDDPNAEHVPVTSGVSDMESMAAALRERVDGDVTAVEKRGDIVSTVSAEADRLGIDLLVVGSHGHGATYDFVVGSISSGIIRQSRVPVLVIPDPGRPRG